MVGHGGSSAGSYLADPTSPIPSHCASTVATSTLRVKTTENFIALGSDIAIILPFLTRINVLSYVITLQTARFLMVARNCSDTYEKYIAESTNYTNLDLADRIESIVVDFIQGTVSHHVI